MRIWVARPEPGATRTGHRLSALGHAPLVAPVLTIRRTGATLPAGAFAGLLLTSANAVAALTTADRARFERIPAFAVGARTATLARRAGLRAVSEAGGDAAHLIVLVRAALPIGSPLLHVTGREGKAEPAASLRAAGYPISSVIAYTAVAETVLPPAVAEALGAFPGSLEAVLHYSRRSAETAYGLACTAELDGAFGALKHYCLSGDVAAPLVAAGLDVHFVAERPDEATLLAGLATGT